MLEPPVVLLLESFQLMLLLMLLLLLCRLPLLVLLVSLEVWLINNLKLMMVVLVLVEVVRIFSQLELSLGFLDFRRVLFLFELLLMLHQTILVVGQITLRIWILFIRLNFYRRRCRLLSKFCWFNRLWFSRLETERLLLLLPCLFGLGDDLLGASMR